MKRLLLLPALLLTLLAQAQNYRPFRPGLLYQLTKVAGDSTYGVRLEKTGYLTAGDSIYVFNTRLALRATGQTGSCQGYQFYNGNAGLFGQELRIRPAGGATPEYRILISSPFTNQLTLRPGAPLNQPWPARGGGITAQVTARGVAPVLGQPDSVVTITFSDGQVLRLSKQWGFVDGPVLYDYLVGRLTPRQHVLTALPTKRLGQARLGALAMYDFQPGDVLWYSYTNASGQGPVTPPPTQYGDSIISRTTSRAGDTITYRIARGSANRQLPWSVGTLVVTDADQPELLLPTGRYEPSSATATDGNWTLDMGPQPTYYNGRPMLRIQRRYRHCGTGGVGRLWVTMAPVESDASAHYVPGLGKVRDYVGLGMAPFYTSTTLIGYRKRGIPTPTNPNPVPEQWGTLPRFGSPLWAAEHRPAASTSVFPNPFAHTLMVRFETQRAQQAEVRLYNGLGQLVHQQTQAVAAGTPQLTLRLPALPAGLYTLHLRHDGRTEVLKVTAVP